MLKLSRWTPAEYEVDKRTKIRMELKRLRFDEVAPVLGALLDAWEAWSSLETDSTPRGISKASARFVRRLDPEVVKNAFRVGIRNPRAVVDGVEQDLADDDGPITTGEGLYEIAESELVSFVMMRLRSLSEMSVAEGKDSSSPSTSSQERETPATPEVAPSIESADGHGPSTAPEIQTERPSSFSQA